MSRQALKSYRQSLSQTLKLLAIVCVVSTNVASVNGWAEAVQLAAPATVSPTASTTGPGSIVDAEETLILNGNLFETGDMEQPVFLIVHGTWGHHGMEIIADLQSLLLENEAASLAITLSLGVSNRAGFLDCTQPIVARHDQAAAEIRLWRDYLLERGWRKIVLVGHSRAGNQVSLYQQEYQDPDVVELNLLAPMVWQQESAQRSYLTATGAQLPQLLDIASNQLQGAFTAPRVINCESIEVTGVSFMSYYGRQPDKDTSRVLQGVSTPTHVYLGTADPISDRFDTAYQNQTNLDHVRLHRVDGADHFFRDFYLDEITEDMLSRRQ